MPLIIDTYSSMMKDCIYHDYKEKRLSYSKKFAFCWRLKKFVNANHKCFVGCNYYDKISKYM